MNAQLMQISDAGKELIKKHEGVELGLYYDAAGLATIGVGHLLTKSESKSGKIIINKKQVNWLEGLTTKQVEDLFLQDLRRAQSAVQALVKVEITQAQYDALVSFVFNVGSGAFLKSTLLKKLNLGEFEQAQAQFGRWIFANKKMLRGLQRRRADEAALFAAA